MTDKFLDIVIKQALALVMFFAFPAFRYLSLKWFTRKYGNPELWYLPKYGFRLVIRNLPSRKTLSDIKYKTFLRRLVSSSHGASVATIQDTLLHQRDDFFLFGGTDQILVAFRLELTGSEHGNFILAGAHQTSRDDQMLFVLTDKFGEEQSRTRIADFDRMICDYVANVKNYFNFDIRVEKRVEVSTSSLRQMWLTIRYDDSERRFELDRIRDASSGRDIKVAALERAPRSPEEVIRDLIAALRTVLTDWLFFTLGLLLLSLSRIAVGRAGGSVFRPSVVQLVLNIHDWSAVALLLLLGLQSVVRVVRPEALPKRSARYSLYVVGLIIASVYGILVADSFRSSVAQVVWCAVLLSIVMICAGLVYSVIRPRSSRRRNRHGSEV